MSKVYINPALLYSLENSFLQLLASAKQSATFMLMSLYENLVNYSFLFYLQFVHVCEFFYLCTCCLL